MTDLPDEAVEAALDVRDGYPDSPGCDDAVIGALEAAAPLIAAQATKDDPRKVAHIECDCVPNLGPSHCHLCSERAGREMPWTEAHPLRAGIEALRDEWRSNIDWSDGRNNYGDNEAWESAADALDALLREGE